MAAYVKRGFLLVLPAVAMLFLAVFVPACGDTGSEPPPRPAPPSEQAAPVAPVSTTTTLAPERTSEPAPTAAPASPTPTPAPQSALEPSPTVAPASPTPTPAPQSASEPSPTVAPASPTPTPAPKPAGYLHGVEHGVALLQTTRRPSETRDGWVDITLTLATLKFGGDAASRRHKVEANSMCYMNRQPPHDCLFVAWGSQEQFEAELTASHPVSDSGSPFQTDILVVAFEVAANATNASLYFGDKHKIPLDLQGDETRVESSASPAPTPGASSGQSAGYFMDDDYGIAIASVLRKPFSAGSTLSLVDVDISVISLRDENGLAPEVNVGVDDSSDVCLGYSPRLECLKVSWGPESQFKAALFLGNEISAEWPRGRGLPTRFGFAVPNSAEQAVIEFGEHRIPIDLRGMTGETPTYDYRLHYQELTVGSTLYDSNQKKVVLEQVRQEADTGGVTLVFSATNDSEAADFAPVIELAGSRVSESGRVFDGDFDAVVGWTPQTVRIEGEKLAPGQSNLVEHTIARVSGKDLGHWRFILYSPNAEERPSGVVLQLTVRDSATDAGTRVSESGHLSYDRTGEESGYWADWAGMLLWSYYTGGSSPAVSGGVVYVGSTYNPLFALDASTGDLLWRYETGGSVVSSPAVSGGVVYVGSRDDYLFALDASTGDLLWRYETGGSVVSSPAVSGGVVYVGSRDDYLFALDASTGDLLWRYETGDDVRSSPAVSGGVVYVGSTDNRLYALDASTGDLLWRYETGDDVRSSPAVSGGVVYVGSDDDHLYALDASTGDLLWSYETGDGVFSSPAVSGGVVYVGSFDGHLYALDASTGDLLWRYQTGGYVFSSPAVSGGVVYVGSDDNHLYALDASTGDLQGQPSGATRRAVMWTARLRCPVAWCTWGRTTTTCMR